MDDSIPTNRRSLRERFPEYVRLFVGGVAACAVVSLVIAAVSSYSFATSFGYTLFGLGMLLMLVGGVSGGGYGNLGAGMRAKVMTSLVRNRGGSDRETPIEHHRKALERRSALREQVRQGQTPRVDHRAYWQVIGGSAFTALGFYFVLAIAN